MRLTLTREAAYLEHYSGSRNLLQERARGFDFLSTVLPCTVCLDLYPEFHPRRHRNADRHMPTTVVVVVVAVAVISVTMMVNSAAVKIVKGLLQTWKSSKSTRLTSCFGVSRRTLKSRREYHSCRLEGEGLLFCPDNCGYSRRWR